MLSARPGVQDNLGSDMDRGRAGPEPQAGAAGSQGRGRGHRCWCGVWAGLHRPP
jgi:hypothetical protein